MSFKVKSKKIFEYLSSLRYFSIFLWVLSLYISYILMFKFSEYALLFKIPVLFSDWFPSQPEYEFFAMKLWFVSLIIGIVFFVFIHKEKDKLKKLQLSLLSVLLALVFYFSFYATNISYIYKNHSCLLMYKSFDCETISNKERYFKYLKKYGFSINWYAKFETLEDSIEAMEFAKINVSKDNNMKYIYNRVFEDLDRFWYDKALEEYKDKTFQVYFVRSLVYMLWTDKKDKEFLMKNFHFLKKVEESNNDALVKSISKSLLWEYVKLESLSKEDLVNFIGSIYTDFSPLIRKIEWVDRQLFF
jgi:hypothetical protein